ncbi:EAL domain-containing protein [Roseibium denhamense]|uniref:PAS domain S-box-containing protein/diguanylate cyclase (GGDEF) domain-containing protein n=1 Tax=Roseibium denhamense TaxID=76305 RepID=A0ABY1PMF0_9HYPH|nr:EAL domain-containing protein [Roseibium denhamense]MTI04107.1 EAL domain-containing protein [Roseibium denhamense]SMP37363.1 PAS domain S-box-containing protein/diguanylate cyclase (GGDEF) domain-containing protein [Roseibium denhamense]
MLTRMQCLKQLVVLALIGVPALFADNVAANPLQQDPAVEQVSTLTAAVPANWPPQYSLDKHGNPQGFAIDVIEHLADGLGFQIEYKVTDTFTQSIELLKSGQADLIPNSGIVAERLSGNLFTAPVETFKVVVFTRAGNLSVTGSQALHGRTVGVVENNAGLFMLRERTDLTLEILPDVQSALLGLLSGKVEAVVYPDTVFQSLARSLGVDDDIQVVGDPLKEIPRSVRFRADQTDLHAIFSPAVVSFVQSPEYQEIYTKWYGIPEPFWTRSKLLATMSGVVIILTILFFISRYVTVHTFNSRLRLQQIELTRLNQSLEQRFNKRTRELAKEIEKRERSQHSLETFFNQSQSLNLIVDLNGNIQRLNEAWVKLLKYDQQELLARPFSDFVHPDDREETNAAFSTLLEGKEVDGFINRYMCSCGSVKYLSWSSRADLEDELVFAVAQDITDQRLAENALKLNASVFTFADEGIMITDANGLIIDVNDAFTAITGYERSEVLGQNPSLLNSGRQDESFYAEMWRTLKTKGMWRGELWNKKKNGEVFPEILTISTIEDEQGKTTNYVGMFLDITKIKAHEKQLEHLARYDRLTGLPNRVQLADTMQQEMARAARHGHSIAIAYIDLDGFKSVNDTFGHSAGDELLISVSRRLVSTLRTEDTLARIGGDEFVAIITDLPDERACISTLDRVLDAVDQDFKLGAAVAPISASIGVTFYPQPGDIDGDQLERQADQAMYEAKVAGRNQYKFFDPEQDRKLADYYTRVAEAKTALKNEEFELFYQPKVNLGTMEIVGYEALLRWRHPEKGLLTPEAFLPPIEKHPEVAINLGNWVLDTALSQVCTWNECGLDVAVSVNASAVQIMASGFEKTLETHLAKHPGLRPNQLEIEILETDALNDLARVSRIIRNSKLSAVRFALDDFGTGYSSLAYLKQLPVDTLKIDQRFVRDSLHDDRDQELVKLIISLGRIYDLDIIAEGVESKAHGELLFRSGCQYAQGYAFAKPMPAEEVADWHNAWTDQHSEPAGLPRQATA